MDCLNKLVGFLNGGESTSESGLYINQLPSITGQQSTALADIEDSGSIWGKILSRAKSKFNIDVIQKLGERYKLNGILKPFVLNLDVDRINHQTPASANWRGMIWNVDTISTMHTLYIQQLSFFWNDANQSANDIPLRIYDIGTGYKLLDTVIPRPQQGWNTVNVGQYFNPGNLFICFDSTNVNCAYSSTLSQNFTAGLLANNFFWGDCARSYIQGAQADDTNPTSCTITNNTFGLKGTFAIQCKFDSVVCGNRLLFARAFQYLLGSEFMIERLYAENANKYTSILHEDAKEMKDLFLAEYENALETTVKGIDMNRYDCCIEVNTQFRVGLHLP